MIDYESLRMIKQRLDFPVRLFLLIMVIYLIFIMVREIAAVKLLAYDVCRLCEQKAGAICFKP